jgi:hypothetical protein
MPFQIRHGTAAGGVFFAAYAGPSMNPTLREPEIMEVRPYDGRPLRSGDVAFFLPPGGARPVVHRIVRVTPAGISTLGDNNTRPDPLLLKPRSVQGRVIAAWRGQNRRKIAGGLRGRWTRRRLLWRRVLDRGLSRLLHPVYQGLSRRGWTARVLPASLRPRVVVFQVRGRDQLQLLLGRRIIGRYDEARHQWWIQRPFRLCVDERKLPGPRESNQGRRHQTEGADYGLALADGSQWEIVAGTETAASIVSRLGSAMNLRAMTGALEPSPPGPRRRLLVHVDAHTAAADCYVPHAAENDGVAVCVLSPCDHWGGPFVNLVRLSLVFARESQARGGALLHGALAERDGLGVILVAPGGMGKTTASNRLPAPWRSRCDDTTLVVRDPRGNYWAHPWPTWSRFLDGGKGGSWDVQNAVPVKGIFFLARAVEDRVEPVGPGRAVSLLGEFSRQVSAFMAPGLGQEELRALHLERFNNLCALARSVPSYWLHLSLSGLFWKEIDRVL